MKKERDPIRTHQSSTSALQGAFLRPSIGSPAVSFRSPRGLCFFASSPISFFSSLLLSFIFISLVPSFLFCQSTARVWYEPEYEPPEHQVDMLHMRLQVSFVPEQGLVRGTVTHRFTPLRDSVDSLFLNGPGIQVQKAWVNGKAAATTTSGEGITFHFSPPLLRGTTDSLTVTYEATPRKGIYFVGWNDASARSRKQIWTQGQGIDNRHWFPCHDEQNDKLTTETIITFDKRYQVLSNGARVLERENSDGTKTWHYRMSKPHATYLVMLGIGRYAIDSRESQRGVPVHLWYYPEFPDRVEPTYRYSAEMLDFIEKETGVPYPWESYSQIPVQDYLYGAMENTTATVFGDFSLVDRRAFLDKNYVSINVHELAHQWFGDYVTGRSGRQSWLHESFATLYPKLFLRTVYGEEYYQWYRRTEQNEALEASENNRYPILHSRAGRARVYQKGSTVLEMMMYTFGDDAFRRVIRHFLVNHAYGVVETNDLYQAFQDVLGITPHWFFEQWIYRGGEPHYLVSYDDCITPGKNDRRTVITVRQMHQRDELVGLFRMPIECEVHYADGSSDRQRVMIEKETESVTIPNPSSRAIAFVLFDPGSRITKKVTFVKTVAELSAQALRAPLMIDRYDALVALRGYSAAQKRDVLLQAYARESFHATKAEIISQLVNDANARSVTALQSALRDSAVEVRLSALNSIQTISPALREDVERLLTDSSYTVVQAALSKMWDSFPSERPVYLKSTANVYGVGNQVHILWHELQAGAGQTASLDSLVDYASASFEFRTRLNAFESLKRLNHLNDSLAVHLIDAMLHPNARLRGPATDVAAYFLQQSSQKDRLTAMYRSRTWLPWQQEILDKTFVR